MLFYYLWLYSNRLLPHTFVHGLAIIFPQMLTELDEWANMTDASDDDSAASGEEGTNIETCSGEFNNFECCDMSFVLRN